MTITTPPSLECRKLTRIDPNHGILLGRVLTRYEVLRGLKFKQAAAQLQMFSVFCQQSVIFPITDPILARAADFWVLAHHQGHPRADADLLIAATALEHARTLVTGNTAHFAWIPGLALDDWRSL